MSDLPSAVSRERRLIDHQPVFTRRGAARVLHIAESSFDILVRTGKVKVIRKGRRVYISRQELDRVASLELQRIWPPKQNGKSTRHFAPTSKIESFRRIFLAHGEDADSGEASCLSG